MNTRVPALRSRILGTGHYVPSKVLTNRDLEGMVATSDDWIVERTGIHERRVAAPDEVTSDLAAHASKRAIEAAGIHAEDIDLIVVATVTPDMPLPSTAMFVQQKIGARHNCAGFDLSAACAGFLYGLSIADQYVKTGAAKYVLVVGVELLSRILDWTDRTTCVLFGDGAGAVVVGPSTDERGVLSTHLYADGSLAEALYIPAGGSHKPATAETVAGREHFVHMRGSELFKFAVKSLTSASLEALDANRLRTDQIDWVIAHQANQRILEGVSRRSGIPFERFYVNIGRFGNTSSASVPIALDEAVRNEKVVRGNKLLLCALGGGVAWGSALVQW